MIGEPIARLRGWLDEARECVRRGASKVPFMYGLAGYAISRAVGDVDFREALSAVREASALAAELNDEVHAAMIGFSRFFVEREAGLLHAALNSAETVPNNREWFLAHRPHYEFAGTPLRAYANQIANRARVLFLLGRHAEAAPAIDEAIEIDNEVDSAGGVVWRMMRIDLAAFRGDGAAAMRDATALSGRGRAESAHDPRVAAAATGIAQLAAGAWADALESFDRAESFGYGSEFVRHRRAEALLGLGQLEEARRLALTSAADFASREMPMHELPAQLVLARVLRRADGAPARDAIEAVLARAEALIAQTGAALYSPELHRERAALAKLLGDLAAHARELSEALRLYAQMGAPLRVAEIERELAETARGEAGRA
jgi:tetratricopeptide (TPR) repeat protein